MNDRALLGKNRGSNPLNMRSKRTKSFKKLFDDLPNSIKENARSGIGYEHGAVEGK